MIRRFLLVLIFVLSINLLAQKNDWTNLNPSSHPSARMQNSAAYVGNDQILIFGGDDANPGYLNDTWIYDLSENSWSQKPPSSNPSSRQDHCLAYIGDDKALLFGGTTGSLNSETWVYDASDNSWTQMSPSSNPSSRKEHSMAYIGSDNVLLFGGNDGSLDNETWLYDLSEDTWTNQNSSTSPSARKWHSIAYLGNDQVILFGGNDGSYNDETWIYDLSENSWTQKSPSTRPSARSGHDMVFIGSDNIMLFGGFSDGGNNNDTWIYDLSSNHWSKDTGSPSGRYFHIIAETSTDGSTAPILFGGKDATYNNETWGFGGGDYISGQSYTTDTPRYTLEFDGLNDYVLIEANDAHQQTSAITITAWVYLDQYSNDPGTNHFIVGNYGFPGNRFGYVLYVGAKNGAHDGKLFFTIGDGSSNIYSSTGILNSVPEQSWTHISAVFDGDRIKTYVNGVEIEDVDVAATSISYSKATDLAIGYYNYDNANYWDGQIDEISIWSDDLTATEIRDNMCKELTGSESNLIAYYQFDHSSGTILDDLTTNNNNGTLFNFALSGSSSNWVTSGAPIGDACVNDYNSDGGYTVNIASSNGDDLAATTTSGTINGIHVYRIDSEPNVTTPPFGFSSISDNNYFGVFIVGSSSPEYTVTYNYDGHPGISDESILELAKRDNNSDTSWENASATLDEDNNTLTVTGESGTEYILGNEVSYSWTELTPANSPPEMIGVKMAYGGNDNIVLFVGATPATWVYDHSDLTWTNVSPTTQPSQRNSPQISYISDDKVLIFGGDWEGDDFNETWIYDVSDNTWTQISPETSPMAVSSASMAYIGDDKALWYFGWGGLSYTYVYDLSEANWRQYTPSQNPGVRYTHTMAYIGEDNVLLVGGQSKDDPWVYDLSENTWTKTNTSSGLWSREHGEMAYLGNDRAIIYGSEEPTGIGAGGCAIYDFSENSWTSVSNLSNNSNRSRHGLAELSMSSSNEIILFGGMDHVGNGMANDTWLFTQDESVNSLPVELISFTGKYVENQVVLKWQTATEINNYGFEVQRQNSVGQINNLSNEWKKIGFIQGHGNSNSTKQYEYIDNNAPFTRLKYRLKQIDTDGKYEYYYKTAEIDLSITSLTLDGSPAEYYLSQNYPNPFNPSTVINYGIASEGNVRMEVFNSLGELIEILVSTDQKPGNYKVVFNAAKVSSGVYFCVLMVDDKFIDSKKIVFLK